MKTILEILPESFYEEDCSLTCEVSYEGISFSIKNIPDHKFIGAGVYHFEKSRPIAGFPIALRILFNSKPHFARKFKKISVVYSLRESVLIPFQLYKNESGRSALDLLFGDDSEALEYFSDVITESGYYNCYRVRKDIAGMISQQFDKAEQWHQFSGLVGSHSSGGSRVYVIFYTYKMVVSVFVDGKCELVNSYPFQTAPDAAFYLLSLKRMFGFTDVNLEVSGFIEKKSSLYQELYKYFENISFQALPPLNDYSDEILQFPSHYFSHLFMIDP